MTVLASAAARLWLDHHKLSLIAEYPDRAVNVARFCLSEHSAISRSVSSKCFSDALHGFQLIYLKFV